MPPDPNITTIREALRLGIDRTLPVQEYEDAMDDLDAVERELADLRAQVRELEADPDRPTVIYAGDELEDAERRLREATDALRRIANEPPPQAWADASEIARTALAAVEGTLTTGGGLGNSSKSSSVPPPVASVAAVEGTAAELPSASKAEATAQPASLFGPEGREGIATVYGPDGTYLGCIGVETWANLLAAEGTAATPGSAPISMAFCNWHGDYSDEFDGCPLCSASQELEAMGWKLIRGTAVTPGEVPDGYFVPEGDKRCNAQTDTGGPTPAVCLLRDGHDGPHRNAQGYWT